MIEHRHAPVLAGLAKSISEGGGKSPEELELAVRQIVSRAISSDKLLGKVKHLASTPHPGPLPERGGECVANPIPTGLNHPAQGCAVRPGLANSATLGLRSINCSTRNGLYRPPPADETPSGKIILRSAPGVGAWARRPVSYTHLTLPTNREV